MRSEFIQKYALLAAYIGTPLFLLASMDKYQHARRVILLWGSGPLLLIFIWSLVATLSSGVAYGAGYERIERKTRPRGFWSVVAAHVFVCCIFAATLAGSFF